jgi:hypothetical protein
MSWQCSPSAASKDEADDYEHHCHNEQNLRKVGREPGNPAEAEKRGNECYDCEYDGPSEHVHSPRSARRHPHSRVRESGGLHRQNILSG